ncbi:MAG: N-6 DNA methylase [Immundisolibacteraceae bacterium]|nr:N-6 DNA methylase [Immundisolibacteraceae bacterium]
MNIEKLETNIQAIIANLSEQSFIYDLLLAYEQPRSSITRLQKGDYNLSKNQGEILWKKKLFFKAEKEADLHSLIDKLQNDAAITRHQPRFIIVTDYITLLAVDTRKGDTLDIPIQELAKHIDFFLPWAGMEKSQIQGEKLADIKAAERMGRLYDLILEDNPVENDADRHSLNIFLSRLLFCFFAEDTGIFKDSQFTNAIASHTSDDGSDLQAYLKKLFTVLNLRERPDYPDFLQKFPYVNGGLFADEHPVPVFTAKSRKIIIECGALNWKQINPDIFGSMMQAVVHTEQRSSMGMHYTSVVNIMKVIEPLFLDDLREELEKAGDNEKKLEKLLQRLYHLRIFDPACGSGNFLIIAYKEISRIEIEVYRRLNAIRKTGGLVLKSNISLSQFYGIELDDFAAETAKLSLWLAEHQMNQEFKEVFGDARPTLPLQDSGHIVCGNAIRISWKEICPNEDGDEVYILGNPPYSGSKNQTKQQKEDIKHVLASISTTKSLDYIACWFIKAAQYLTENSRFSFVSTNSLFQGTQVPLLWPFVLGTGAEIYFAYKDFLWSNNARNKAGVTCSIVGVRKKSTRERLLFEGNKKKVVTNINPYLYEGKTVFINNRTNPLSKLPRIQIGNEAYDCGNLTFLDEEKSEFVKRYPESEKFFKKIIGSNELINGFHRWCLWIEPGEVNEAEKIEGINERIMRVRKYRETGGMNARSCMDRPYQFRWINRAKESQIVLPVVSSQRRQYIPMDFVDKESIIINSAQVIFDPEPFVFGILNSKIHMAWVRFVGGKLKTDYRYNAGLCYNCFPIPDLTEQQKDSISDHVFNLLEERERHTEMTLAQLYDPDKMPEGLRLAHHEMDLAVEQCYRSRPFKSDEERLEYLFKLYEEMTAAEAKQGK